MADRSPRRHVIREATDKWRYACPNGHRSWTAYPTAFHCKECAQASWPHTGRTETLIDERTGETVRREDLDIRGRFWFRRGEP